MLRKEQAAQAKMKRKKVTVMDFNAALRLFNKVGASTALPERKYQVRKKVGRIYLGRPLTSAEILSKGAAETVVNQASVDLAKSKRNSKPEDFTVRGKAAATKLAANNGDPQNLTAGELKYILRFKGAEEKYLKDKKQNCCSCL